MNPRQVINPLIVLACFLPHLSEANVEVHTGESEYQNGRHEIQVLKPDNYDPQLRYRVLYVLPVAAGLRDQGLDVLQAMDVHNAYNLILVSMTFEKTPWFGDHPSDPKTRQESFLKKHVVPFVEARYSVMAAPEGRLLFGFSKSGWGAFSLILRDPEFFGYAAAWDSPFFFSEFHFGMDQVFGTLEHLAEYRPDLLVDRAKGAFQSRSRLVVTGETIWGPKFPPPEGGTHTVRYHELLERNNVQHSFDGSLGVAHSWNAGWVAPTLDALMRLVNSAPVGKADVSPTSLILPPCAEQVFVGLDGSESSDPDNDLLEYLWFIDDAPDPLSTEAVASVSVSLGLHTIRLVVDDGWLCDTNEVVIDVVTPTEALRRLQTMVTSCSDPQIRRGAKASLLAASASIERGSLRAAINQCRSVQNKIHPRATSTEPDWGLEVIQGTQSIIDALQRCVRMPSDRISRRLSLDASRGRAKLEFFAVNNSVYFVEVSCDMATWQKVGVARHQGGGRFEFQDTDTLKHPSRFYRIVCP